MINLDVKQLKKSTRRWLLMLSLTLLLSTFLLIGLAPHDDNFELLGLLISILGYVTISKIQTTAGDWDNWDKFWDKFYEKRKMDTARWVFIFVVLYLTLYILYSNKLLER